MPRLADALADGVGADADGFSSGVECAGADDGFVLCATLALGGVEIEGSGAALIAADALAVGVATALGSAEAGVVGAAPLRE